MQHRPWDPRDDDAIIHDCGRGVFADSSKVRETDFEGGFFRSRGRHFVAPSPQRRPVLWQAGVGGNAVLVRGSCGGAKAKQRVCPLVSHGADSVDEFRPSGFKSSAVAGDRRLGELGGCEL
jgi:hypothetical protein